MDKENSFATHMMMLQREIRELRIENDLMKGKALRADNLERKVRDLNYEIHDLQT